MKWASLALLIFLVGCTSKVDPQTQKAKYNEYDVLAQLRESGWVIAGEEVKADHRDSKQNTLYFEVNGVLFCGIFAGENPDQQYAEVEYVQAGGYSVYSLPMNTTAEDWEIACEEELGAICSVPFEQKMLMVQEWQDKFLADSKAILEKFESAN